MGLSTVRELLPKAAGSVYKLVRIASSGLWRSVNGAKLVPADANAKLTTIALDEIRAGKVVEESMEEEYRPKRRG